MAAPSALTVRRDSSEKAGSQSVTEYKGIADTKGPKDVRERLGEFHESPSCYATIRESNR